MQLFLSPLISLPESWNTWKRRKNSQITIWVIIIIFFYYFREKKNREYEGGIPSSTIAWLFFSTSKQYSVFPFTIFLFVQQKLYLGKICKVSVLPNFGLQTGKVGNTVFGLQQLNFDIIKGRGKKKSCQPEPEDQPRWRRRLESWTCGLVSWFSQSFAQCSSVCMAGASHCSLVLMQCNYNALWKCAIWFFFLFFLHWSFFFFFFSSLKFLLGFSS